MTKDIYLHGKDTHTFRLYPYESPKSWTIEGGEGWFSKDGKVFHANDKDGDGLIKLHYAVDRYGKEGEDMDYAQNYVFHTGRRPVHNDVLTGDNEANTLTGDKHANKISGKGENDRLTGNDGNDRINGGTGDDRINGGLGNDVLIGGKGADTFVFDPTQTGKDTIVDFNLAEGDRIEIVGIDGRSAIGHMAIFDNGVQHGDDFYLHIGNWLGKDGFPASFLILKDFDGDSLL